MKSKHRNHGVANFQIFHSPLHYFYHISISTQLILKRLNKGIFIFRYYCCRWYRIVTLGIAKRPDTIWVTRLFINPRNIVKFCSVSAIRSLALTSWYLTAFAVLGSFHTHDLLSVNYCMNYCMNNFVHCNCNSLENCRRECTHLVQHNP